MSSIAFLVSSIMLSVPAVFRPSFAPQNNSFMESFDQIWCDVFSFHPAILEVLPGLLSPTHQILSTESYSFYLEQFFDSIHIVVVFPLTWQCRRQNLLILAFL